LELTGPKWGASPEGEQPGWPSPAAPPQEAPPAGPQGRPGADWWPGQTDGHATPPWPSGRTPVPVPPAARGGVGLPSGNGKPKSTLRRVWERTVGTLAAIGAFLAKFGALLIKLKYLGLVLSMLVSVAAYALFFGWTFAACFVLLIFVHEMGHVIELRRQGVPATAPLFIPFLGAFVGMKGSPRSAFQEALSGLAGPLFGTAAAVVVAFWANATGSKFLEALAFVGFFMNMFNLLPMLPLDGGRAAAALHPAIWLAGLLGLIAWEVVYPSPVIPIILILGGYELWRRWRHRNSPASRLYYALAPQQRLTIGVMYLALVAVTVYGSHATYVARSFKW
jgi:Zn-dependent protease